jgi:ligand-binding SRPBCC domain-containing protein
MFERYELKISSRLSAPPATIWDFIRTLSGINHELFPLARMTHPGSAAAIALDRAPVNQRLFRSWILLGGVLPIDYSDLTIARVEPGRGFTDSSPMLSQKEWCHERRLDPDAAGGCVLTDRVAFRPRLALLGTALRAGVGLVLRHRHKRLRQRFGGERIQ